LPWLHRSVAELYGNNVAELMTPAKCDEQKEKSEPEREGKSDRSVSASPHTRLLSQAAVPSVFGRADERRE
jgi:hypothetical protein